MFFSPLNYTEGCFQPSYSNAKPRLRRAVLSPPTESLALAVAIACSQGSANINGAQAISKSYPHFFEDYQKVNGKVEY
jgi:hypothetical protein